MLNLSDKELDRFSKEAAQEYEPGDVLGERSWERLAVHLDRDLGHVSPNPLRHIRRFPFYYAPAVLVLLGVSYYFIRKGSGGPPGVVAKAPAAVVQNPLSSQSPVQSDKSTPASSTTVPAHSADYAAGTGAANRAVPAGTGAASAGTGSAGAGDASVATGSRETGSAGGALAGAASVGSGGTSAGTASRGTGASSAGIGSGNVARTGASRSGGGRGRRGATGSRGTAGQGNGTAGPAGLGTDGQGSTTQGSAAEAADVRVNNTLQGHATQGQTASRPTELERAGLLSLQSTKTAANVDDSALRAFTRKSTAPQLIRNRGMHINRSLEFGVVLAPDFASVNSVAGDRPGSTVGLTLDYQFANRWYIGTGLLLDRKNYAARGQDFHAPPDYFQNNGIRDKVELVKGSFEMLEIPLNLRYDFSVSGSTLFFASTGLSSYLFASENNNYYYHLFNLGPEVCRPIANSSSSYLFSSLNLSAGVETGLSNSLSLLIAPYMKVPVRGIGIGRVQMNTVGINFSLRWAPVISRKRY